ncbi:rhodanese-like domain-containing protein [Polynucleobacter sp. es-EL-1]|jgi:rhodanese-related sulfurtransferase|uniref:rhodanese-like domain-containing protein n=1 Tax=Polynucleobacter sp. es-EL-1 TaxID=1855652 RepID=UPI000BD8B594|nr:rhodanese-like domain-containing protein [Polynucleobacter sp. es-EL-1]OYW81059.1 MAG: sulfurtransferase [Polynucleobacter sp. 32-46-5]OYZ38900.1 MAG: sulfurtransferase [Polynucleobacter sp. 16-46-70]OZA41947.1 MAG: sulfurtransferase [Polynucleobacter sp. 17-46-58]HQR83590.1 rhodanese-like domain-containing protein [Polynucleobacter sp.]QWE10469.1 rhodanese-like domain-containing protein [Polynucleobacter sp. es-EL-1]
MNFLTQFDNLALIALMFVSGLALFFPTLSTLIGGKGLSPTEATIWMNRRKAAVLDLRPEADFKAGHLPGSKHILASQISSGLDKLKLDRKNPVILVCHSGISARKVVPELQKMGFAEVVVLDGGVQAWQASALPLVK